MLTSSRGRVGWDVSVPEFAVLSFGCGFRAFSLLLVFVPFRCCGRSSSYRFDTLVLSGFSHADFPIWIIGFSASGFS